VVNWPFVAIGVMGVFGLVMLAWTLATGHWVSAVFWVVVVEVSLPELYLE
jgi:hypothetical protein